MAKNRWQKNARPRVERLEDRTTPANALIGLSVSPSPINEGDSVTLTGSYTASCPVGSLVLDINWGDGSPTQSVPIAAFSPTVPLALPAISHTYLDDNPTATPSDPVAVSATLRDTGPSVLTPAATGVVYRAYDIPGLNINLASGFGVAGSGVVQRLSGQNDVSTTVNLGGSNFRLYGVDYANVIITDNGLLQFTGTPITTGNNTPLTAQAPALVSPFWDDLTTVGGNVFTKFIDLDGDGASDYLCIEWSSVFHGNNAGGNAATFQALLQLTPVGGANGDIIFNYIDTTFGNPAFDGGASATVGIKGVNGAAAGSATLAFNATTNLFGDCQAVRFSSVSTLTGVTAIGPTTDSFGYRAYRSPFESRLDIQSATVANGNVAAFAGVFNSNGVVNGAISLGANTFNYYGTTFSGATNVGIGENGLLFFGPTTNTDGPALNTDLTAVPQPRTIAPLWDDWVGAAASANVFARLVDLDGNGTAESLVVEWSQVQNNGFAGGPGASSPATFQAIMELNTGGDAGEIYFNYVDTDVTLPGTPPNANFNNGASATVGIKDVGTQGTRRLLVQQNGSNTNDVLANQRAIVIIQAGSATASAPAITVNNVDPTFPLVGGVSQFAAATLPEGTAFNRVITFTDPSDATATTGDTFTAVVDFGDGTAPTNLALPRGSRSFTLSHVYADDRPTNYVITVSGFRDDDQAAPLPNMTIPITVTNVAPTLTLVPNQLIRPGQVLILDGSGGTQNIATFTDPGFSYMPAGTVETFTTTINWGDGQTDTVPPNNVRVTQTVTNGGPGVGMLTMGTVGARHNYSGRGTFTVTVTVTDDNGGTTTSTFLVAVGSERVYTVAADAGSLPIVRVFDSQFQVQSLQFTAYDQQFRGGVRVAVGDFTGDGLADIVTAPGAGGGPDIRVYDGASGNLVRSFFAYDPAFRGGVFVAVGDINGDRVLDIVTAAGKGGGPHVKVFSGVNNALLFNQLVFDANFRGGVAVASGDVNGDMKDDIIVGAGEGGGPHVKIFSGATKTLIYTTFPYDTSFRGGVFVAAGDVNGDGRDDLIVGPGNGGGPRLRVINVMNNTPLFDANVYPPGTPGSGQFNGSTLWTSGLRVAASDLGAPRDGFVDVIVGPATDKPSRVKILDGATLASIVDFTVFDPTFLGGVFVGGN